MRLVRHRVTHYRNISAAELVPSPRLTVICGQNGQGKTNLLESIWLLCGGKSFRESRDVNLVQRGQPYAVIESQALQQEGGPPAQGGAAPPGRSREIRLVIGGEKAAAAGVKPGRSAQLDGADCGRAVNLAANFFTVIFTPGHLSLVQGGPEQRRRFFDAALMQLYPGYITLYRRYYRTMQQKNALLKDAARFEGLELLLDGYDEELARRGGELIRRRGAYLEPLGRQAQTLYGEISDGREQCSFLYRPCARDGQELLQRIQAARREDLLQRRCTVGPHLEDLEILIDGQPARAFGSQGQQRSAALALKLAEARGVEAVTGQQPVVLLDDVLSELDSARRDYLLRRIEGWQVLLTSCDASLAAAKQGDAVWQMEEGVLRQL